MPQELSPQERPAGGQVMVAVSGKAYFACLDPGASSVPTECGFPAPTWRKVGKGSQAVYVLTREQALDMAHHLWTVGDSFAYGDPETRAEGRACLAAAGRVREAIAAASSRGSV